MADRYFVGTGGFSDGFSDGFAVPLPPGPPAGWNNVNYWSTISGGPGGASVPGAADKAIFDGNSPECGVDVKPIIQTLALTNAFTSTLSLYSFGITVGTGGIAVGGGTLHMGTAACQLNAGQLTTSGGTLVLTSNTLTVNSSDVIMLGGVLTHNSGTLALTRTLVAADVSFDINGRTLYNMTINFPFYNVVWQSNHTVLALMLMIQIKSWATNPATPATISIKGDIEIQTGYSLNGGDLVTLLVNNTTAQEIRGNVAGSSRGLPNLTVNKAAGTLSFTNQLTFKGTDQVFEHIAGTMDWSGCTQLRFEGQKNTIRMTSGPITITCPMYFGTSFEIIFDKNELRLTGNLDFFAALLMSTNNGSFHLQGADNNFRGGSFSPGTAVIVVDGTDTQVIRSSTDLGKLASLRIDKASGDLTMQDEFYMRSSAPTPQFEYVQGSVTATAFNLTLAAASITLKGGALKIGNLTFNGSATHIVDGPLLLAGNLSFLNVGTVNAANLGRLYVEGDLSSTDVGVSGNCPLNMTGTNDQEISMDGFEFGNGDVVIDKTGGKAVLVTNFAPPSWSGSFTIFAGTLDLAGFDFVMGGVGVMGITDTLDLKGNETLSIASVGPVWGAVSTARFYDESVVALVDRYDSWNDYKNVVLDRDGTGKVHQTTAGATVTFEGLVSTGASKAIPAIIRSSIAGTQANWILTGTETLGDAVVVKDNDASGGLPFNVIGSIDAGNTDNWFFGGGGGGGRHLRVSGIMPVNQGYVAAMNPGDALGYVVGMGGQGGIGGGAVSPVVPVAPFPGPGSTYSLFVTGGVTGLLGPTVIAGWNYNTKQFDLLLTNMLGAGGTHFAAENNILSYPKASGGVSGWGGSPFPTMSFNDAPISIFTAPVLGGNVGIQLRALNNKHILMASATFGANYGIYETTDGFNWTPLGIPSNVGGTLEGVYATKAGTVLFEGTQGQRTVNNGASWSLMVIAGAGLQSDFSEITAGGTLFFLRVGGGVPVPSVYLCKSTNEGVSWTYPFNAGSGLPVPDISDNSPVRLLALTNSILISGYKSTNANEAAIMRSTDGGLSWTRVYLDASANSSLRSLYEDPSTGDLYGLVSRISGVAGIGGVILRSNDQGATWSEWFNDTLNILGVGSSSAPSPLSLAFGGNRR